MENIKKEYEELKKKYKLPDLEELDKEFELFYIPDIKEINFPLRFVRRRINDRFAFACNMLQSLLQPNPGSLVNMAEASNFDKEEKLFYCK